MLKLALAFPSLSLLRPVRIEIGLPYGFNQANYPCRTVWALHCAMEDGSMFFNRLFCEDFVDVENCAVVAPSLGNFYFVNSDCEAQADFLCEIRESLPGILPLSPELSDNVALGISMGGFGAVRWALDSNMFGECISISGVFDCNLPLDERLFTDRAQKTLHKAIHKIMLGRLLGHDGATRKDCDLNRLASMRVDKNLAIKLYCGDADYLALSQNEALYRLLENNGLKVELIISPGSHDIGYWQKTVREALGNLFKNK